MYGFLTDSILLPAVCRPSKECNKFRKKMLRPPISIFRPPHSFDKPLNPMAGCNLKINIVGYAGLSKDFLLHLIIKSK